MSRDRIQEFLASAREASTQNNADLASSIATVESERAKGTPAEYAWNRVWHAVLEAEEIARKP